MKTPDEIKKGLECCEYGCQKCYECPYKPQGDDPSYDCVETMKIDSLALIQQLKRERDAAVADIPRACGYCKWFEINRGGNMTDCHNPNGCRNISGINTGWEWRGVKEEQP